MSTSAAARVARTATTTKAKVKPARTGPTSGARPAAARALAPARREPAREASPFVKWVGGKGRLMSQLLPLLPPGADRMRHVEPFAGGAAMFYARRPQRALLCDLNTNLIDTYLTIRDDVDELIAALHPLAAAHGSDGNYYRVRESYNEGSAGTRAERAAQFIYLNKTCFNGLHRVNRRGEFNVPEGRYKSPRILDADNLYAVSELLQSVEIRNAGFEEMLSAARPGDFVYFDPPYEPVSQTASFTRYTDGNGFSQEDQTRLRDVFAELDRRGCKLMLSNSDVPFIRELYGRFNIDVIAAARAINCDAKRRGPVAEVVVRNY